MSPQKFLSLPSPAPSPVPPTPGRVRLTVTATSAHGHGHSHGIEVGAHRAWSPTDLLVDIEQDIDNDNDIDMIQDVSSACTTLNAISGQSLPQCQRQHLQETLIHSQAGASSPIADLTRDTPPPAYTALAHDTTVFDVAPLLNGVPGEIELESSDGKRFLVHQSVLEREAIFFHIYFGFVPAWRLSLSPEESIGLPPNPHIAPVFPEHGNQAREVPAESQPGRQRQQAQGTQGQPGNALGLDLGLSGLSALGFGSWCLPRILANVRPASTGAQSSSTITSVPQSASAHQADQASITAGSSTTTLVDLSSGDQSDTPARTRHTSVPLAPPVPPKDSRPRPHSRATRPPTITGPVTAPTPTTSPYKWRVPESSGLILAFLSLIYPPRILSPSRTTYLTSPEVCARVIRTSMGYQSVKATSIARDRLSHWISTRPVTVYALASYFKFPDLVALALPRALAVPEEMWTEEEWRSMGNDVGVRLMRMQEARVGRLREILKRDMEVDGHESGCEQSGHVKSVWKARCEALSEGLDMHPASRLMELLDVDLGISDDHGAQGCARCLALYGKSVRRCITQASELP